MALPDSELFSSAVLIMGRETEAQTMIDCDNAQNRMATAYRSGSKPGLKKRSQLEDQENEKSLFVCMHINNKGASVEGKPLPRMQSRNVHPSHSQVTIILII